MKLELVKKRSGYALDTFVDSWVIGARKFFPLLGAWALTLLLPVLLMVVGTIAGLGIDTMQGFKHGGVFTLIGLLVPGIMIGWMWPGWMYFCLKLARDIPVKWTDLFRPLPEAVSGLIALSITSVLIGIGMILVVPGVLLYLKWQLVPFYIVDRKYGPIKAMKQSWEDTDRLFVTLGLMDLLFAGVFSLIAATVFGPVALAMAFSMASALVYHRWLTDEEHPDMPRLEDEEHESAVQ